MDSYIGSNAFGVEKVIKKRELDSYDIRLSNYSKFCRAFKQNTNISACDIFVSMATDNAKLATGSGKSMPIVYVITLTPPYFKNSEYHDKPTINNPNESIIHSKDLVGELKALYVLDTVNKKIAFEKRF